MFLRINSYMTNMSMNNEPVTFQKCVEIQVTSGFTSNYLYLERYFALFVSLYHIIVQRKNELCQVWLVHY